jgi:hypothetical protein
VSEPWNLAIAATIPPHAQDPHQCVLVAYRIGPAERRIVVDFISTLSWPV